MLRFNTVYTYDSKMLIKLFTNNIESSKSIFNIVVGKFISLYLLTHPYIKSRFCETFVFIHESVLYYLQTLPCCFSVFAHRKQGYASQSL